MAVRFLHGDPGETAGVAARIIQPRPARPLSQPRFRYTTAPAEAAHPVASEAFLWWQARESALATLDAWSRLGRPLRRWAGGRRTLTLVPNDGQDLNAYYDRKSVRFFEAKVAGKTFRSGASLEIVAHEVGHGLLDALRPDLWFPGFIEASAFHEGFGDAMALLAMLEDPEVRQKVIPHLGGSNFVETYGENLAEGIRLAQGPTHNASAPRHARNNFHWSHPSTLPASGPPGTLVNEPHSLGQLVTGPLWRLVDAIFNQQPAQNSDMLLDAAVAAGTLFVAAASRVAVTPRLLQTFADTVYDEALQQGRHATEVHQAFAAHSLTPRSDGPSQPLGAGSIGVLGLSRVAKRQLRTLMGAPDGAAVRVRREAFAIGPVLQARSTRPVDLTGVSDELSGVRVDVVSSAMLRQEGHSLELLAAVTEPDALDDEVRGYVDGLVERGRVQFPGQHPHGKTHRVQDTQTGSMLRRLAFACRQECRDTCAGH